CRYRSCPLMARLSRTRIRPRRFRRDCRVFACIVSPSNLNSVIIGRALFLVNGYPRKGSGVSAYIGGAVVVRRNSRRALLAPSSHLDSCHWTPRVDFLALLNNQAIVLDRGPRTPDRSLQNIRKGRAVAQGLRATETVDEGRVRINAQAVINR